MWTFLIIKSVHGFLYTKMTLLIYIFLQFTVNILLCLKTHMYYAIKCLWIVWNSYFGDLLIFYLYCSSLNSQRFLIIILFLNTASINTRLYKLSLNLNLQFSGKFLSIWSYFSFELANDKVHISSLPYNSYPLGKVKA